MHLEQQLARPERVAAVLPGQLQQPEAVQRRLVWAHQVAHDVAFHFGAGQVGRAGSHEDARPAQLAHDLQDPGMVLDRVDPPEGDLGGIGDQVAVGGPQVLLLRRAEERPQRLDVAVDLAELELQVLLVVLAEVLDDLGADAGQHLGLAGHPDEDVVEGPRQDLAQQAQVHVRGLAVEDPLGGHEDVVEDHPAVHLVEAGGQAAIRDGRGHQRGTAEDPQAGCVHRQGEVDDLVVGQAGAVGRQRHVLIGERRQRGHRLHAVHHDAVAALLGEAQVLEALPRDPHVLGGVGEAVGQRHVVLAAELQVGGDVVGVAGLDLGERGPHVVEAHDDRRHVLRQATQRPAGAARQELDHAAAAVQVLQRLREDVAEADGVTARRRLHGQQVPEFGIVLQVVDAGERLRASGQGGVRRDIVHQLAVQPDLPAVADAFEVVLSGADPHGSLSLGRSAVCSGPPRVDSDLRRNDGGEEAKHS